MRRLLDRSRVLAAAWLLVHACGGAPASDEHGSSSSEGGPTWRCAAEPGAPGGACACSAVPLPAPWVGWDPSATCEPAADAICCDDGVTCTCAAPQCWTTGGGCVCGSFAAPPGDAIAAVAACDGLLCCDEASTCTCADVVQTCSAAGMVDACVAPVEHVCAGGATMRSDCTAPA